jgi:hypothetical protein
MEQQTFRPCLLSAPDPAGTLRKFPDDTCAFRCCSRGLGWAERRAASYSYQTLTSFYSTAHCTLGPKNFFSLDKRVCLACLPSFRPGRWLRGSGQALSLNFYKTCLRVRPAAPPPAPSLPLTPQGCLVSESRGPCKVWGRWVRWAGLRTLV